MRDEHDGLAGVVARVLQKLEDGLARVVVERARRLVAQQKLRVFRERAGDGHALLLAAGKLRREVVQAVPQPHLPKHRGRIERLLANLAGQLHVLKRGEVLHEVVELEHEADVIAAVVRELFL